MTTEELCKKYDTTTIQQLYKIMKNDSCKDIFPVTILQSVFDGITGTRLDHILSLCNHIYVPYAGTSEATRLQIGKDMRRKGLIITFRDLDNYSWTQRYKGEDSVSDSAWQDDSNWEAWDFDSLLNDITKIIQDIFQNVDNYDGLKAYILEAIKESLKDYMSEDTLKQLIEDVIKELLPNQLPDVIKNYFNTEEGKNILKTVVKELLDDMIGEYIEELQTALLDNERVTANALARHETAITEIQNQINT